MEKEEEKKHHLYSAWIFTFAWIFFFAIIGIIIQSLEINDFTFLNFFTYNYLSWFNSFGNFVSQVQSSSWQEFFSGLIYYWYYFFFTGGLLSLIWLVLTSFFSLIFSKKEVRKVEPEIQKLPELKTISQPIYLIQDKKDSLNEWLEEGLRMLSENNIKEAEIVYENIRRAYNPLEDLNQTFYLRIKNFYEALSKSKSNKN